MTKNVHFNVICVNIGQVFKKNFQEICLVWWVIDWSPFSEETLRRTPKCPPRLRCQLLEIKCGWNIYSALLCQSIDWGSCRGTVSLFPPNNWMLQYLEMPWSVNWASTVHLIMVVNHLWCIIQTDYSNFQGKKGKVSKSLFSLKYCLKVSLKFVKWNL